MLPYQQELIHYGGNLYYAIPSFERIEKIKPQLADAIVAVSSLPVDEVRKKLSTEYMRNEVLDYSLNQAVKESFAQHTGYNIDAPDIYLLASTLIPKQYESFTDQTWRFNSYSNLDEVREDADKRIVNAIKGAIDKNRLAEVLSSTLKRRGIILYFNGGILEGNRVLAGHEAEEEIMIVSQKPLSSSVISGIEVLSDSDNAVLIGI